MLEEERARRGGEPEPDPARTVPSQSGPVVDLGTRLVHGSLVAERFQVESFAGMGGMGAVYRAVDHLTGKPVALKTLLGGTPDGEERFSREARVLSELDHPGIVRYVAHGRTRSGTAYLVMEWLDGEDLASVLARSTLTLAESLTLAERLASALAAAHARNVVHRDLNPRNIFLVGGAVEESKLLDFGIAHLGHATRRLTLSGSSLGTPGYMAPEQAQGAEDLDPRVDVFALGCVLFECLTARPAFVGHNVMALLTKILLEEPPRAGDINSNIPPELDELVTRMLAKNRGDRPASGAQLAELLQALGPMGSVRPTAPAAQKPAITGGEKRLLSVILASQGPEGEALSPHRDPIAAAVEPFGGNADFLLDGSLVVTLGGGGNANDQAARAARAALALRAVLPDARIALSTGRGEQAQGRPVGEAIDRALELLSSGVHGQPTATTPVRPVLLDEVTAGLLDPRFDVSGEGAALALKGTRELVEPARTLLGKPTSCVGRQRELITLEATYAECAAESVARAVLVTAPVGYGKSRVRHELLRRLRRQDTPPELLIGQGDSLTAGAPFAIIAQALRRAAGIRDGEPLAVRQQKLRARVRLNVPEADQVRLVEFLGELVGSPFPDDSSVQLRAARQDPMLRGDQMRRAFEDFLSHECNAHPVLLLLEDLHWGDLPTIKLVDALLRNLRDRPLMVLALARPEVHEQFPELWDKRGLFELRLPELTARASEQLVREVLGDLEPSRIQRLVRRAGGNAFWLEELIRAEAEGRGGTLPDTVVVMAQARLERLGSEARRVLRAASVFGQQFWRGAIKALLGGDEHAVSVDGLLEELEELEVITPRAPSKFPGEDEFEFRHALLRDAAYEMLTEADREVGHQLAGQWLERAGEIEALVLAEHFERGGNAEGAIRWYLRAGRQALEGNDPNAALARARRGISLGAQGEELGALELLQAETQKWRGQNREAQRAALGALDRLYRGGPAWFSAAGEAAAASGKAGDGDALVEIAELLRELSPTDDDPPQRLIALARTATQLVLSGKPSLADALINLLDSGSSARDAEPAVMAWVHEAHAVRAGAGGDPAARVRLAEAAADSFEQAGDLRNACLQRVSVGFACVEIGAYAAATRSLSEALTLGERMGLNNSIPVAQAQLARALSRRGKLAEGIELERQAVAALAEQGNQRLSGVARGYLARMLLESGDAEGALAEAKRAAEMLEGAPALLCSALATLALVQLAAGHHDAALEAASRGAELLGRVGESAVGESLVRQAHIEALAGSRSPGRRGDRRVRGAHPHRGPRRANRRSRVAPAVHRGSPRECPHAGACRRARRLAPTARSATPACRRESRPRWWCSASGPASGCRPCLRCRRHPGRRTTPDRSACRSARSRRRLPASASRRPR